VASLIETGLLQAHVSHLKQVYGQRMATLCSEIERLLLPLGCKFAGNPGGGFFVWIELPSRTDGVQVAASDVVRACQGKVAFQAGDAFSVVGRWKGCIRLACSFYLEDVLLEGVSRIARELASLTAV
jgi:DNA-binding transcriptional MocR family regulator